MKILFLSSYAHLVPDGTPLRNVMFVPPRR